LLASATKKVRKKIKREEGGGLWRKWGGRDIKNIEIREFSVNTHFHVENGSQVM